MVLVGNKQGGVGMRYLVFCSVFCLFVVAGNSVAMSGDVREKVSTLGKQIATVRGRLFKACKTFNISKQELYSRIERLYNISRDNGRNIKLSKRKKLLINDWLSFISMRRKREVLLNERGVFSRNKSVVKSNKKAGFVSKETTWLAKHAKVNDKSDIKLGSPVGWPLKVDNGVLKLQLEGASLHRGLWKDSISKLGEEDKRYLGELFRRIVAELCGFNRSPRTENEQSEEWVKIHDGVRAYLNNLYEGDPDGFSLRRWFIAKNDEKREVKKALLGMSGGLRQWTGELTRRFLTARKLKNYVMEDFR